MIENLLLIGVTVFTLFKTGKLFSVLRSFRRESVCRPSILLCHSAPFNAAVLLIIYCTVLTACDNSGSESSSSDSTSTTTTTTDTPGYVTPVDTATIGYPTTDSTKGDFENPPPPPPPPTTGYDPGLDTVAGDDVVGHKGDKENEGDRPDTAGQPSSKKIDEDFIRGLIAVSIDEKMQVGQTYIVEAAITRAKDTQVLTRGIDTQNVRIEAVQVSSRMEMTLTDPTDENFKIKELNSTRQGVTDKQNTVWRWGVVPLNKGENILVMTAKVIVTDQDGTTNYDIPVYNKQIVVNSTFAYDLSHFLSRNWEFLTPIVFIPVLLWGRKRVVDYLAQRRKATQSKTGEKEVGFLIGKTKKQKDNQA